MPRPARLLLLAIVATLGLVQGCATNYHYIAKRDGAPVYEDEDRSRVIGHLERLEDGYMGHFEPDGDPVKIRFGDGRRVGWANRADLRIFRYHNDDASREYAVATQRREVVLEAKDWPERMKRAIREDRVERGMTPEMVRLAWGMPSGVAPLEKGERWTYDARVYDSFSRTSYEYVPGASRMFWGGGFGWSRGGFGWGPAWGWSYDFPSYQPVTTRTYFVRNERKTVTFSEAGVVAAFESREW